MKDAGGCRENPSRHVSAKGAKRANVQHLCPRLMTGGHQGASDRNMKEKKNEPAGMLLGREPASTYLSLSEPRQGQKKTGLCTDRGHVDGHESLLGSSIGGRKNCRMARFFRLDDFPPSLEVDVGDRRRRVGGMRARGGRGAPERREQPGEGGRTGFLVVEPKNAWEMQDAGWRWRARKKMRKPGTS